MTGSLGSVCSQFSEGLLAIFAPNWGLPFRVTFAPNNGAQSRSGGRQWIHTGDSAEIVWHPIETGRFPVPETAKIFLTTKKLKYVCVNIANFTRNFLEQVPSFPKIAKIDYMGALHFTLKVVWKNTYHWGQNYYIPFSSFWELFSVIATGNLDGGNSALVIGF